MKKIVLMLFISANVWAQNVDYNKIILPDNTQTEFAEKLVQLAWKNNPTNEAFRREVNVAGYEVKKNKVAWLDIIHVQGNINEFVLNPESDFVQGQNQIPRSAFYPKYNIRGDISLAMFFTIPYNTKQSRERMVIAQSNVNAQKLAIRATVLKAYNDFLWREKVYKIQSQLLLDNETSHKLVEQRFKSGETTFETYSTSLNNYSNITINQLNAERDYKNSKLDLEALIGMKLEDVR
ncbi:MAG: TolC family protein [Bacteroidota bacterium]